MPPVEYVTLAGLVALAVLLWVYSRMRSKDRIDEILTKHRGSASVCSRANLVEGMEMIPVALALKNDAIYYENTDIQASIELALIEEVEYDDETATGHTMPGKVLRIRAHNHLFEFPLDLPTAPPLGAPFPPSPITPPRPP